MLPFAIVEGVLGVKNQFDKGKGNKKRAQQTIAIFNIYTGYKKRQDGEGPQGQEKGGSGADRGKGCARPPPVSPVPSRVPSARVLASRHGFF